MSATLVSPPRKLLQTFETLKNQWIKATEHFSSPSDIAMHPAYQRIIGLGPQVIPLILQSLESQPNAWFWALKSITGEDPVPPEDRGRVAAMTDAWLNWGREQGWISE